MGEQLNLPVQLDKDLQELHFGAWEGQSAAALMETDAEALGLFWADPYAFTPPQGEPVSDFSARVLAAVARLHQRLCWRARLADQSRRRDASVAGAGAGAAP